jgi:hypothetical protein
VENYFISVCGLEVSDFVKLLLGVIAFLAGNPRGVQVRPGLMRAGVVGLQSRVSRAFLDLFTEISLQCRRSP